MVDSLYAWENRFGSSENGNLVEKGIDVGTMYKLHQIGKSSQSALPIFAVKLSMDADNLIKKDKPRVLILGQCHAEEIYGVEISMAFYFVTILQSAWSAGVYFGIPFLLLFQTGFLYTGIMSLFQPWFYSRLYVRESSPSENG